MVSTFHRSIRLTEHVASPMRWLFGFIVLHSLAVTAVQMHLNLEVSHTITALLFGMLVLFIPVYLVTVIAAQTLGMVISGRRQSPTKMMIARARLYLADRPAVLHSLVLLLFLIIFFDSFTRFKAMIPEIVPFGWDVRMTDLDRALHGGVDPWLWLHPITQHEAVIKALDMAYAIWLPIMYIAILHAVFSRGNTQNRHAFVIGFVLLWALGGNAMAVAFSSAGPAFFDHLGLGGTFDALNSHLAQAHESAGLISSRAKDALWQGYQHGGAIESISAFPSMHVGSTALITLFAFSHSRALGWAMVGFLAMMMAGSVSLAWHYAVDGYAAMILALITWRLGHWFAARSPAP